MTATALLLLLIYIVVAGFVIGGLARLLVPGPDPIGFGGTVVLGIVGSFVGGFLSYLLFRTDASEGAFQVASFFGSVVGAVIALLIYRAVTRGRAGRI